MYWKSVVSDFAADFFDFVFSVLAFRFKDAWKLCVLERISKKKNSEHFIFDELGIFFSDMKRNLGVVVDYSVSNDVMTLLYNQKSTEFHVPRLPVSVYNSDACK